MTSNDVISDDVITILLCHATNLSEPTTVSGIPRKPMVAMENTTLSQFYYKLRNKTYFPMHRKITRTHTQI